MSTMNIHSSLEAGNKFLLAVPGLDYQIELPQVAVPRNGRSLRIASLNLTGQISLNRDLGELLASSIRDVVPDLSGVVMLTVVERSLQLTQVVAEALGLDAVAVAYNRVKPHMEASSRPVIQVGVDSITSGAKYLCLYERDIRLLAGASRGIIIIDDVISTGGTIYGLEQLVEEVMRHEDLATPPVLGVFCVAAEGSPAYQLNGPIHALAELPAPTLMDGDQQGHES